jgi:PAS domain S-box-containing protein
VDIKGNFTFINDSMCKILGYEREELLGMNNRQYSDEENARKVYTVYNRVYQTGEPVNNFEWQIIRKDGDRRDVEVSILLIRDREGHPTGFRGIVRDITDRKLAEEALRESEELYKTLAERSMAGVYIVQDGSFRFINSNAASYAGYTREELLNQKVGLLVCPEDSEKIRQNAKALLHGEMSSPYEYRIITKQGETRWIMETVTSIVYQGRLATLGNSMDITERKRAEEVIREGKQRLQSIIDGSPIPAFVIGKDHRVIHWNKALEEMSGIKFEEVVDTCEHWRAFYSEKRPCMADLLVDEAIDLVPKWYSSKYIKSALIKGAYEATDFFPALGEDGKWLRFTASAIRDSQGMIVAAVETLEDITERKREEEEKRSLEERLRRAEKMEALGTLAGGVAHDLNNVLGGLVGYSELLLMDIPEENPWRKHVSSILNSSLRAAAIIQDLLTLSRRGVTISEVVNLNKLITEFYSMPEFEKMKAYHPNVSFKTDIEEDLLNVKGSPVHLGKVLMNMLSNAAEAISDGGDVAIRTENRYLDKPIRGYDEIREGDYVVLTVSDNGKGISAMDIEKIFEPFYTKKVMGRSGTGLGLAVVWGTVKDHNGYIDVQSEDGKGSTFTIYFPATREELPSDQEKISPEHYMGRGESILVVDDVKEQREVATSLLTRLGYKVHAVSSGE